MRVHMNLDFDERKVESSYCSRILNAIPFVDNNLPMEERKKYLLHIENCSVCIQYIQSLRKDFTAIEKLIPRISRKTTAGEEYTQKVKSLTNEFYQDHLVKLIHWGGQVKGIYRLFISRWKS